MHLKTDAQHGSRLERRCVQQLSDRLGHAGGVLARIARIGKGLDYVAIPGEGDDFLGESRRLIVGGGTRRYRDVFRHDLDLVGAGHAFGKRVAESLRVDIVQRGDLHGAVDKVRAGFAHHLFHLIGGKVALFVEGRCLDREIDGLQAHLAFDLGAIDLAGGGGGGGGGCRLAGVVVAVVAEHLHRVERRIGAIGRVPGGKRHLDLHERHGVDDVAVADLGYHRHFHAPAILGLGDLARRHQPGRLGDLAGIAAVGKADQFGDLGRRRQLLAPVKSGKQRHAHQNTRRHTGEEGARQPARRNLAPVGRAAATVRNQRRFIAEIGYDIFRVWHPERLLLPRAERLVAFVVAVTFACHGG